MSFLQGIQPYLLILNIYFSADLVCLRARFRGCLQTFIFIVLIAYTKEKYQYYTLDLTLLLIIFTVSFHTFLIWTQS